MVGHKQLKRMKYIVFSLITSAILVSCSDPNQEIIDALKAEAIAVHDEVMPRMGEIADLRSALKKDWKLAKADTGAASDTIAQIIASHITMLDSADEAMMSWMADYNPTYAKDHSSDSAISYYARQGDEIKDVQVLMEKAIEDAEKMADYFK